MLTATAATEADTARATTTVVKVPGLLATLLLHSRDDTQLGGVLDVIAANVTDKTTLASTTVVNVLNGSGTVVEQVKFKSDCSQPVNLGDQYGGFTVFGMRTTNGGALSLGSEVNYTYTITNTGSGEADNVTAQDDKLGTLPGTPIAALPAGASMTFSAGQLLDETTINTVTVV